MLIVDMPEPLRERLWPEGARALAEILNETAREMRSDIILLAEQKFERRLAEELARVRVELGGLESRLIDRMARLETRLIRWAVGLWLGQFAVLIGILFAFFRH